MNPVMFLADGAASVLSGVTIDVTAIVSDLAEAFKIVLPAAISILGIRKVGSFILGTLHSA